MDVQHTDDGLQRVDLTADIVSAYVGHNPVRADDLAALIRSVHTALTQTSAPAAPAVAEPPTPAVPIRRSVTPAAILSLEDGKPYRTLKRHLTGLGLTPDDYRSKWGLPADYPMVAPDYSAKRSALAKAAGLGRGSRGRKPRTP